MSVATVIDGDLLSEMKLSDENNSKLSSSESTRVNLIGKCFVNNKYFEEYINKLSKFFKKDDSKINKAAVDIMVNKALRLKELAEEEAEAEDKRDSKSATNFIKMFRKIKNFMTSTIDLIKKAVKIILRVNDFFKSTDSLVARINKLIASFMADAVVGLAKNQLSLFGSDEDLDRKDVKRGMKRVKSFFNVVKSITKKLWKVLKPVIKGIAKFLAKVFKIIFKAVGKVMLKIFGKLGRFVGGFLKKLALKVLRPLAKMVMKAVAKLAARLAAAAAANIVPGLGQVVSVAMTIWAIADFALMVVKVIKILNGLADDVNEMESKLRETVKEMDHAIRNLELGFENMSMVDTSDMPKPDSMKPEKDIGEFAQKLIDLEDNIDKDYPTREPNNYMVNMRNRSAREDLSDFDVEGKVKSVYDFYNKESNADELMEAIEKDKENKSKLLIYKKDKISKSEKQKKETNAMAINLLSEEEAESISSDFEKGLYDKNKLEKLYKAIAEHDKATILALYNSSQELRDERDKKDRLKYIGDSNTMLEKMDEIFDVFLDTTDAIKSVYFDVLLDFKARFENLIEKIDSFNERERKIQELEKCMTKDDENKIDVTISEETQIGEDGNPTTNGKIAVEMDITEQKHLYSLRKYKVNLIKSNKELYNRYFGKENADNYLPLLV